MADVVCISPIDGREVARRMPASAAQIAAAIDRARAAQPDWARVPMHERKAAMLRFLAAMRAVNDEVVVELALQMGRPVRYGGELRSLEERVGYMIELAERALKPITPPPQETSLRRIERRPRGLVLSIAPWNYPFLTAANTIIPALLAGNAVLLKAASQTLLTGERFQRAMDAAGVPRGVFQNLLLGHEDVARLLLGGHIDHVSFTGSVEGGRAIEHAAAGTFTSVALELGGKDPAYVRPDARLGFTIENIVEGAFFNSGQSCCAIERIYVHEAVYARFIEEFMSRVHAYVLEDPLDAATTLGPMAATRFAERVREHTREALARGARAHIDPALFKRDREDTPWLAPQVLTGVDHGMRVMREESFGPVVGVMRVRDDEQAVAHMNDSPYGLSASIWTEDLPAAECIGERLETGTVYANRCDYLDPALAWTGVKDSGRGASLSRIGYEMLTRPKSYLLRRVP